MDRIFAACRETQLDTSPAGSEHAFAH
jgi:hypothetical protein